MRLYVIAGLILVLAVGIGFWVQPGTADIPARAVCLLHNWRLLYALRIADLTIFASYMAIPYFIFRYHDRIDIPRWVAWFFIGFIFFCGFGHLVDVVLQWYAIYSFKAAANMVTAIVSIATVIGLKMHAGWLDRPSRKEMDAAIKYWETAFISMNRWKQQYRALTPEVDGMKAALELLREELRLKKEVV